MLYHELPCFRKDSSSWLCMIQAFGLRKLQAYICYTSSRHLKPAVSRSNSTETGFRPVASIRNTLSRSSRSKLHWRIDGKEVSTGAIMLTFFLLVTFVLKTNISIVIFNCTEILRGRKSGYDYSTRSVIIWDQILRSILYHICPSTSRRRFPRDCRRWVPQ